MLSGGEGGVVGVVNLFLLDCVVVEGEIVDCVLIDDVVYDFFVLFVE